MTRLLTLTWPSGVWKTTLAKELVKSHVDIFCEAIAFTTRVPRDGEVEGEDYYFMSREEVIWLQGGWELLRISDIHGNLYGHTKEEIQRVTSGWKIGVVIPDLHWLKMYKQNQSLSFQVLSWIIIPESWRALWRRLQDRREEWYFSEDTRERWKTWWEEFVAKGRQEWVYDFEMINHTNDVSWTVEKIFSHLQQSYFLKIPKFTQKLCYSEVFCCLRQKNIFRENSKNLNMQIFP